MKKKRYLCFSPSCGAVGAFPGGSVVEAYGKNDAARWFVERYYASGPNPGPITVEVRRIHLFEVDIENQRGVVNTTARRK